MFLCVGEVRLKEEEILMERYKIDEELKRWIRHVLVRGFHEFRFVKGEDGDWECEINVTETTFEKIKDRAVCEKYAYENNVELFVVTAKEAMNTTFITYMMTFLNQKSFMILDPENYIDYDEKLHLFLDDKAKEAKE